jgi:hypothetical protein
LQYSVIIGCDGLWFLSMTLGRWFGQYA